MTIERSFVLPPHRPAGGLKAPARVSKATCVVYVSQRTLASLMVACGFGRRAWGRVQNGTPHLNERTILVHYSNSMLQQPIRLAAIWRHLC